MTDYEKIIEIAKSNQNMFKTKFIVDAGIRKERIRELLELGEIKRIGHGYYALVGEQVDSYYEIQQKISKAIFSYETAAYLWGLSEKEPMHYDCCVPRGYNTSKIRCGYQIKYHYVLKELYEVGLTEILSPEGHEIRVHDKERVICDFIRHRRRISPQVYSKVLNSYFKGREKDIRKLAKYGRIFHISRELNLYIDVL